ncbi:Protein CBG24704, partial [Caenorhabditis briggsae]
MFEEGVFLLHGEFSGTFFEINFFALFSFLVAISLCSDSVIHFLACASILSALNYSSQVTDIEETNTKTRICHQWFNTRIRQYMILEIFFVISLIMILSRFQTISNQNERVLEMVKSMQSQIGTMERKLDSLVFLKSNQEINQFEGTIADALKNIKFPTQDSSDKVGPIIIPQINRSISKTEESDLKIPIPKEQFRLNAADFIKGASVDIAHSSSSSLNPITGYDQTNLVLLDRLQSPSDKAWCTNAENPVLTINLAKYIKSISVSYQHSKWHRIIPNGSPKTYDVV